ncbi:unnamed protein product, partial [Chrysoparadoxa australica]
MRWLGLCASLCPIGAVAGGLPYGEALKAHQDNKGELLPPQYPRGAGQSEAPQPVYAQAQGNDMNQLYNGQQPGQRQGAPFQQHQQQYPGSVGGPPEHQGAYHQQPQGYHQDLYHGAQQQQQQEPYYAPPQQYPPQQQYYPQQQYPQQREQGPSVRSKLKNLVSRVKDKMEDAVTGGGEYYPGYEGQGQGQGQEQAQTAGQWGYAPASPWVGAGGSVPGHPGQ